MTNIWIVSLKIELVVAFCYNQRRKKIVKRVKIEIPMNMNQGKHFYDLERDRILVYYNSGHFLMLKHFS